MSICQNLQESASRCNDRIDSKGRPATQDPTPKQGCPGQHKSAQIPPENLIISSTSILHHCTGLAQYHREQTSLNGARGGHDGPEAREHEVECGPQPTEDECISADGRSQVQKRSGMSITFTLSFFGFAAIQSAFAVRSIGI